MLLLLRQSMTRMLSVRAMTTGSSATSSSSSSTPPSAAVVDADDEPIMLERDPYKAPDRQCIMCANGLEFDYKNARLLSQFISSFTGRTFDRHITRLCYYQQRKLLTSIKLSRTAGYMPVMTKNPRYLNDPQLADPMNPIRPNPY